jgi:hypothetical protein
MNSLSPTRKGRVPCLGVWIIEFAIQLNEGLFRLMAEGHAGPPMTRDGGRHHFFAGLHEPRAAILPEATGRL